MSIPKNVRARCNTTRDSTRLLSHPALCVAAVVEPQHGRVLEFLLHLLEGRWASTAPTAHRYQTARDSARTCPRRLMIPTPSMHPAMSDPRPIWACGVRADRIAPRPCSLASGYYASHARDDMPRPVNLARQAEPSIAAFPPPTLVTWMPLLRREAAVADVMGAGAGDDAPVDTKTRRRQSSENHAIHIHTQL